MTTLYGIKNCDSVKKARTWLAQHNHEYVFHDFRADGLNADKITTWLSTLGAEVLVNKRSTTWKQLTDEQKGWVVLEDSPRLLMLLVENPTLIKRPVLEYKKNVLVGFKADTYASTFA